MSNQTASDVQKDAGKVAEDAKKQASSLVEQGTALISDTLTYAQQQAQGILGSAKNSDASKQTQDAANDASKIADNAAKEGKQDLKSGAESTEKTLHDLTDQARHLVGDILHSTNEYIKPQEAGDQAQGYIAQARNLASTVIDKSADIISGAQKEASKLADDPEGHGKTLAQNAQQSAHDGASKVINTVADSTK